MSSFSSESILEIGDVYEDRVVINKVETSEKCPGTGEGPCGQYYFLTLQALIAQEDIKDIHQCDVCRQIVQQIGCY